MSWFNNLTESSQFVLFSAVKIICVFSVLMFIVAYAVWVERKLSAAIQDRRGPNRVGIFGLLQPVADAIKSFLKFTVQTGLPSFRSRQRKSPIVPSV